MLNQFALKDMGKDIFLIYKTYDIDIFYLVLLLLCDKKHY